MPLTKVFHSDSRQVNHSGQPAPEFTATAVVDGQFKEVKLSYYRGFALYVVLFFYLLDFTFVCPTEIVAFSERAEEFRKSDCEVLAASTDSHFIHLAWINTEKKQGGLGPMKIPLLADPTQAISRDYGVLKEDEGIAYSVPSRKETRERHHRSRHPEEQGVFLQTELIHPHLRRGATSIQGTN
ncbi:peroxiredoxin-2 [Oncorhynchus tshawytscha]|uniref:peroxiredoxin-2 n=1 Tax=Oncorhynchus tshawytscha TaxID=74940 RepID=UPI000D09E7C3|nr:peroxiredoxin-2 [Oncorhynchus tshawytscha]